MNEGRLESINVSDGGVPKTPVPQGRVGPEGLEGDRQRDLRHHGGPDRAVCIYSLERIEALEEEGHPIAPGTIGENFTLSGLDWDLMVPGAFVDVGEVRLELTRHTSPCEAIAPSFHDGRFVRVSQKVHPGWSRFYARVVSEGVVRVGDRARLVPPP
ncbi:MAG: MOSC domain-containing protein [Acidobacteria bacterium]|nr:MOSC domain-containing protein [Acidobacteriota bacterium]